MAWLLLLLAVALLSVVIVTRNLLLADLDAGITAELVQESGEFDEFAAIGVDPATGRPFANAGGLLQTHLARQRPGPDQVQIGVFADGTAPQAQGLDRNRRAITPEVLTRILDPAVADTGEVDTPEGLVRWARTLINRDAARVDGYFVVGELVAPQRAEIDDSIRTLAAVSGIGLLLAGIASWIVSSQILAPLRLVRRTAEEITEEDLTRRITVSGRDDLSALADCFNSMLDRLQRTFATQREFVDDAGHELRTPITIIRGNLEVMGDDPAERAEVVRVEPVELTELTSDIDAKVRALADRRWTLESCGDGEVRMDAQRITQAIVQFAQNAVQHTGPGDPIRLGSAVREGGVVELWVADSGPGVRPEDAKGIFERFSRGSTGGRAPTAPARGWAGLGWAIVRAIAEAHGGRVRLDSTPGEARFTVELPVDGPTV